MKGKQKIYEKGITLIALVITIIILLILAGVTISIVFNDGIAEKSQTAVDKYSEESAKEKLSLALFNYKMGVITGEAGETDGKKSLNDYLTEVGGEITKGTEKSATEYTIEVDGYEFIVNKSNYEITSNLYTNEYNIGDTVTIGEEQFYVLADSDSSQEKVTLITKYNLNKEGTAQAPNATYEETGCAFSSTSYWDFKEPQPFDLNDLKEGNEGDAIAKAKAYAKKVTGDNTNNTGRLLTYDEANELKTAISTDETGRKIAKMLWGQENKQSDENDKKYLIYWLGSAYDTSYVWFVIGNVEGFWNYDFSSDYAYGVRPVLTVSKSLVSTSNGATSGGTETPVIPEAKKYTITYNANGGTGKMTAEEKTEGTAYTIASNGFTGATGYAFKEWNTQADGKGTKYTENQSYNTEANLILYAIWYKNEYNKYNIGDTVTIGEEQFYVLADSDSSQAEVTLITKYNLNKEGTAQAQNASDGETACAFASAVNEDGDSYWKIDIKDSSNFDLNDLGKEDKDKGDAIAKAKSYAKRVAGDDSTGRLLTYDEANELKTAISTDETGRKIEEMLWGQDNEQSEGKYLYYWLGSAQNPFTVWCVRGYYEDFSYSGFDDGRFYGVRPVITVSKSLVS